MSNEVVQIANQLKNEWANFKADNDRRLAEAAKNGGRPDPLTEEKINKHSVAIGELEAKLKDAVAQLDEVQAQAQRRAAGGGERDEKAAKARENFEKFMRTRALRAEVESFRNAVSIGSDPAGGFTVPETLDPLIEKYAQDGNPMRQVSGGMPLSNENYEKLVEEGEAGAGWLGEGESSTETSTPTLRALKPYFGKLYAEPKSTQEALEDSAIDVEKWLAEAVGTKFASQENAAFTSGNGIKKPRGFLAYTMSTSVDGTRTAGQIQKVHSGSSGAFVADKLFDVVHALHAEYRAAAKWMLSNLSLAAIRKLKDTTNQYLWQPGLAAGAPSTLLGYGIVENEAMPTPAADSLSLAFGDFRRGYGVYDVRGISILRDPLTSKGYVKFFTTKRVGGMVINDRAIKVMALST